MRALTTGHAALGLPRPSDDLRCYRRYGQASIGELVERSTLGGYGYDAVVRSVFAGQLRLVEYCKLDFDTLLTRAPKGNA
jgi:hypothetical protein